MEQRQFVETMKRLYKNMKVDRQKIIELHENKKITEEEKNYILDINLDVE